MNDKRIVDLFWQRDEQALAEVDRVYHRYLYRIVHNILLNERDTEECLNDTYLRAWNTIPPHRPARLSAFLGKIARRLALDRYDTLTAEKRGGGIQAELLEEWRDCLPQGEGDPADDLTVKEALTQFLWLLPAEQRRVFVLRYWYGDTVKEIAAARDSTESRIKMMLSRIRGELKEYLEKEGIAI